MRALAAGLAAVIVAWTRLASAAAYQAPLPCQADYLEPAAASERMLVVCHDRSIAVIDLKGGKLVRKFSAADFGFAGGAHRSNSAISPDGGQVALAFRNGWVGVWSLAKAGPPRIWKAGFYPNTLVFTPDGRGLFADEVLLDLAGPLRVRAHLVTDFDTIKNVAISPDGSLAAVPGADTKVRLYDTATWKPRAEFDGLAIEPFVALFIDGGRLAIGSADGRVRILSVPDLRPTGEVAGPPGYFVNWIARLSVNALAVHYHPNDGRGDPKAALVDLRTLTSTPWPSAAKVTAAAERDGKLWFYRIDGRTLKAWSAR